MVEKSFRSVLEEQLESVMAKKEAAISQDVYKLIDASFACAVCKYVDLAYPVVLVADTLDASTIDMCENVFNYLEGKIPELTQMLAVGKGKLILLHTFNKLLKRLSKTNNTLLCGRILMFMSAVLPLDEKSALNLNNEFNVGNVTLYEKDVVSDDLETEESLLDYGFYKKFWEIQNFCRKPQDLHAKPENFAILADTVQEVLKIFSSQTQMDANEHELLRKSQQKNKTNSSKQPVSIIDVVNNSSSANSDNKIPVAEMSENDSTFFFVPKYLTSRRLLNLQIRDREFRKQIFVQLLFLFDYLQSDLLKHNLPSLSEKQREMLKLFTEKIYSLLEKTPPNGKLFLQSIVSLIKRERSWVAWKADRCKNVEEYLKIDFNSADILNNETQVKFGAKKKYRMGHPHLEKLWSSDTNEDNLKRLTFTDFMAQMRENMDPEAGIEEEYKLAKNSIYVWKGLRLITRNRLSVASKILTANLEYLVCDIDNTTHPSLLEEKKVIDSKVEEDADAEAESKTEQNNSNANTSDSTVNLAEVDEEKAETPSSNTQEDKTPQNKSTEHTATTEHVSRSGNSSSSSSSKKENSTKSKRARGDDSYHEESPRQPSDERSEKRQKRGDSKTE